MPSESCDADFAWVNGTVVPARDATIPVSDIGLLRGYAVFDYMRTWNKRPFLAARHLDRFYHSAASYYLDVPLSRDELMAVIDQLLLMCKHEEAAVRLILTGGCSPDSMAPAQPNFIVVTEQLPEVPGSWYTNGVKLITHNYRRLTPETKSTYYANAITERNRIRKEGAYDLLYFYNKRVLELSRNNIFAVINGQLCTPGRDVLKGITRSLVMELAADMMPVVEKDIALEELLAADEAMLCGTTKKVIPVVNVDGQKIGDGRAGPVAAELLHRYNAFAGKNV